MTQHLDALTLSRWADGLLAPEELQRAAAHLALCAECSAQAASQSQTARWLRLLAPEAAPPQLARNIVAALAAAKAERRRSEAAWAQVAAVSTAAALLGLLLVALAWRDLAGLLPAMVGVNTSLTSLGLLLDLPADTLAALANSTFDWGSALTSGAGAALLTGLVLLTGAAFGGLAQLLRPASMGS